MEADEGHSRDATSHRGYNAAQMWTPRITLVLFGLWLVGAMLVCAENTTNNAVDEKIRKGDVLQDEGNLRGAREIYESVLETLRQDEPSLQLGDVLNGLSNLSASEGDYKRAFEFAQQAENVYQRIGNVNGQSAALNSRAIAEGELGRYLAAQATLQQALALSKSVGDQKSEVRTLNNLGNAYYFPGNYLGALRSYQEARQIIESQSSEKWSEYWLQITKINQATLYQRLGRYQTALEIYREIETSKGLTAGDRAHMLTNLGVLYRRLGDPWKALNSYQIALELYSQQRDTDGEISVLKNIGIVHALDRGNLDIAQGFFRRSLALAEKSHNQREEMQSHLYLGETLLRKKEVNNGQAEFEQALAGARKLGTAEEQWKSLYGIGQAEEEAGQPEKAETHYRAAISIIETTRTQLQLSALRAEFLADKRDVYDALIALLLKKNDVKETFLFLERSRSRTFQDRLASTAPGPESATPKALDLMEVQKYIAPSTVLMEFWASGDHLALIWCTRDSYGMEQAQLSATERETVLSFLRGLPNSLGPEWRQHAAVLGLLFPADLSLPGDLHHAVIVPDGWLSSVPFDLVPFGGSAGTLLIESFDISYLPTAALLRRPQTSVTRARFPWNLEMAAFGDPSFGVQSTPLENLEASAGFQSLPFSEQEIQSISKMTRGRAELFLGSKDVKRAFISGKARSAPILHVSTHAFADADVPESSRILFSPETSGGAPDYLFLREVYDLNLSSVDLATLSACDTERGAMIRGEGVQAFSRALLFAGSRSALTTLWRVSDQPTSEFMKQFYYFAIEKRQSKAEALRSAKLKFLHSKTELASPAHWAAFVLNGDGVTTLPAFISWSVLVVYPAMVMFAVAGGFWLVLRIRRRIHGVNRP